VGTDLPAEALIRLADHPNVVIDKEAMARPGQIAQILAAGKDMAVMCCDSPNLGLVPAVMALGGHGTANLTGRALRNGVEIVQRLGLAAHYAYQAPEEFIGDEASPAGQRAGPAMEAPARGSGACFIR
jgi:dihydrodipicolinate synthase/N-acetylneuraminate lyase